MRRRHGNRIAGIMHNGIWVTNPKEVKKIFLDYFQSFFDANDRHPLFSLGSLTLPELYHAQFRALDRNFLIEEIERWLFVAQ